MLTDWNFWFSAITAVVAIVAVVQTKQQIKISNKQHLFDKRVEYYLIAKGLIQLYESNQTLVTFKKDEPVLEMTTIFTFMTNNSYLENITYAIVHSLEQPYHKEFLAKRETLKEVSSKIKFSFGGSSAILLADYVLRYQELLFKMYQYQIMLKKMEEVAQKFSLTREEAQKSVGESGLRKELRKASDNLKQAYDMIKKEKVEKKIEKQIKLK